jgi:5-methylcytosine-specific restriction enzyme A
MSSRAAKLCAFVSAHGQMCFEVVPSGQRHCPAHKREPWKTATPTSSTGAVHAAGWPKLRASILDRDDHKCQIRGPRCRVKADQVDHIREVADGGTDDPSNLQSVCEPCHRTKTGRDGRARQLGRLPSAFDPLYQQQRSDEGR